MKPIDHAARLPGELEMTRATDRDAMRGRDAAKRIRDTVLNWKERGRTVLAVRVDTDTANALIAYFRSFARVLVSEHGYPTQVEGAPLEVVMGQGENVTFVVATPEQTERVAVLQDTLDLTRAEAARVVAAEPTSH